jgi:TP901 family phage tail tape measure protein
VSKAYSIETVFKLIDRVTAPTSKIDKALNKIGLKSKAVSNALKHDFDKAAARVDKLGASMKKWGGRAVLGGVAAIGAGVGIATKQFIEFDTQLYKAGSIFSDLDSRANDFQTRLDRIGKAARDVAAATEFNAEQTARALSVMAMAGIKSSQAISLLPKVADMATAASLDLDQAVGMAADALNVFGKMVDDPLKLAKNFQYVSDIMVKTANLANMDLSDMYGAVKTGGSQFTRANQRIEDFGAAVDVLAAVMKGAEAGTKLNTMMTRLSAPVTAGANALKALGIRTKDTQGNLLNFVNIIEQLKKALAGMGDAQQAEYIKAIFGQQQYNAASLLIKTGAEGFRVYAEQLETAAGSTQQAAEAMRQSIKNKLAILGSAATEMGFKFVEAFKDKAVSAIESATRAIEKIDVAPLVEFATVAGNGIMKFAGMLSGAVKTAWEFRGVIIAIVAPLAVYQGALMAITIATGAWSKITAIARVATGIATGAQMAYGIVIKGNTAATASLAFVTDQAKLATAAWTGVMKGAVLVQKGFVKTINTIRNGTLLNAAAQGIQAAATGIATGAQWAFNAAMTANPIGVIIIAIIALIAIIVLLAKSWDKVTTAVKKHFNKIMAVFTILLGPIGFIISMIKEIASNFGRIKEALAATGLFDKIREIGEGIKNIFGSIGEKIVGIWNAAREKVANFFNGIGEAIMAKISPVVNWITNAWHTATSRIGGFFKGIFDAVYTFVKPALDWFSEKWQQITAFFKDNAIINAIKVIGGTLLSGLLIPVQGLLEILSYIPGFGHLAGKGADKIQEFRNFLKGVDGTTVNAAVNVPDEVAAELTPPTNTGALSSPYDALGFGIPGIPDLGITGAGGKSKLHGVVDISGGVIPTIDSGGNYSATGALNNALVPAGETLITRTAIEIAAILRKINAGVSFISSSLPVSPPPIPALPVSPQAAFPVALPPIAAVNQAVAAPGVPQALTSAVIDITAVLRHIDAAMPRYITIAPETNAVNQAVTAAAPPSSFERNIADIAGIMRSVDASLLDISHNIALPVAVRLELFAIAAPEAATRMSLRLPKIDMSGGEDEDAPGYHNPRQISPITPAERMVYNLTEQRVLIEVAAERGTAARIVRSPRDVDIKLVRSGGNA